MKDKKDQPKDRKDKSKDKSKDRKDKPKEKKKDEPGWFGVFGGMFANFVVIASFVGVVIYVGLLKWESIKQSNITPRPQGTFLPRQGWPVTVELDKPQDTIEQQIALGHEFSKRLIDTTNTINLHGRYVENEMRFRQAAAKAPEELLPPWTEYSTSPSASDLLAWYGRYGISFIDTVADGPFREVETVLNDYAVRPNNLTEAEQRDLRGIVRVLGRDGLKIPYDAQTDRFRFAERKPQDAPEVVAWGFLEMASRFSGRDAFNSPLISAERRLAPPGKVNLDKPY